jgi:thymidylate synthase
MGNKVDEQYQNLLRDILLNGREKESGRPNMPNTIGISNAMIKMDLSDGFPLLTTKKMYWKGIVHELLWFLRGETNIKYLVDNKVNIWNGDAYRWYLNYATKNTNENTGQNSIMFKNEDGSFRVYSEEEFVNNIKLNNLGSFEYEYRLYYKLGDLGKVYGFQWRNQNGVDQVKDVIDGLQTNPNSRYHIIDGWNKADFRDMALPPCHLLYQFICRPMTLQERKDYYLCSDAGIIPRYFGHDTNEFNIKDLNEMNVPKYYLDLNMYQRSSDTLLGNPYNLASMSLLCHIMAKTCNMVPGVANWIGGDTHLYLDHIPMVKEQLTREPYYLPTIKINKKIDSLEGILSLTIDDFQLYNYQSHEAIKAELFTGNKK